jgi:homocysteine S-methyltransferase
LANLTAADTVRAIHEDNIRAGADIVTTNTFMSGLGPMGRAGAGDRFEEGIRAAVGAARDAVTRTAQRPVTIAGCVSARPWGTEDGVVEPAAAAVLREDYARQVDLLAGAGVDLIALEMVTDPVLAGPAVDVALGTGLPVWLGLSTRRPENPYATPPGDAYASLNTIDRAREVAQALLRPEIDAVNVMHTDALDVSEGLAMLRGVWDGPLGAYPHHGRWARPNWIPLRLEPERLAELARGWIGDGATMIGGCCGVTAAHIGALRRLVDEGT